MKLLKISLLVLVLASCKAQQPTFVGLGKISTNSENYDKEFVEWYNKLVDKPTFDTVSAFIMPTFSDLRYVLIRTLNPGDVARVEKTNGQFQFFLHKENMVISIVGWNEKGEVVQGLDPIMVSGCPLVVQYERCPDCKFTKQKGGL